MNFIEKVGLLGMFAVTIILVVNSDGFSSIREGYFVLFLFVTSFFFLLFGDRIMIFYGWEEVK